MKVEGKHFTNKNKLVRDCDRPERGFGLVESVVCSVELAEYAGGRFPLFEGLEVALSVFDRQNFEASRKVTPAFYI